MDKGSCFSFLQGKKLFKKLLDALQERRCAHVCTRVHMCEDHSCSISPVPGLIISLTSFGFDSAAISAPCMSFIISISNL